VEKKPEHTPPSRRKDSGSIKTLLSETALRLYDMGFNIIPVARDKRPLSRWSSFERLSREELERLLEKAEGVAVAGGERNPFEPSWVLGLVDVDNPGVLGRCPFVREVVESTVAWYTGPRCPKCYSKHVDAIEPGSRFRCRGCGAEFTLGEAGRGLGAFVLLPSTLEASTIRGGGVELLVNNYQLVPPSVHSTGVQYEWVRELRDWDVESYFGIRALTEEEAVKLAMEIESSKKRLEEFEAKPKQDKVAEAVAGAEGLRELSTAEINRIVELLKDAYRPGVRQFIWLFLSGWAAKAGVSPVSVGRALRQLYEEAGDTDSLRTRASAIIYSYRKAGLDVDAFTREFEDTLGVKPYGLEREIKEEDVKGISGLQEILESTLGEERALEVLRELEEILGGTVAPGDSIIEVLDYKKQLYAVANLRKLIVARAERVEDRLIYRERVFIGAPTKVVVYINPVGGVTKYKVVWEIKTRPRPIEIGPAYVADILDRLSAEGLVTADRLARDVLNAVIEGFVRRGRAEIREEIESPGFYEIDGRIVAVNVDSSKPDVEELREALLLLNELAEWYKHVLDKFSTVVKWALAAPFAFCYKRKGRWVKWLYLYGASRTGKTTLGEIVLKIWGLDSRYVKTGASIDTPARIGYVISQYTFPTLVNEPGDALSKTDIVDIIKNAVESPLARGKFVRGSYVDIPALSPFIFTSNRYLPKDDTLLRRFIVLRFTYGEKLAEDRIREFEEKVKPKLDKLRHIGAYIASYVAEHGLPDSPQGFTDIIKRAYEDAGLKAPEWLDLEVKDVEDIYLSLVESVRNFMLRRINEEYARNISRVFLVVHREDGVEERVVEKHELEMVEKVKAVLEKNIIPWLFYRGGEVIITMGVMRELEEEIGDIGGLKSLAELLKWEYRQKKIAGKPQWCVITSLEDFVDFLVKLE